MTHTHCIYVCKSIINTELHLPHLFIKMNLKATFCCIFCILGLSCGKLSCVRDPSICQRKLSVSSVCKNGSCTNPYEKGCLATIAEQRAKEKCEGQHTNKDFDCNQITQLREICEKDDTDKDCNRFIRLQQSTGNPLERVCNSNDKTYDDPFCTRDGENKIHSYDEVRIAVADWDTAPLPAWILQIMLSEIFRVPTTLEYGRNGKANRSPIGSFYDRESRYELSEISYPWDWLKEANRTNGDCSETDTPCAHIMPELWSGAMKTVREEQDKEYPFIFHVSRNGMTGQIGYYIPTFTAQRYPELATYFGLRNNRELLAKVFKTPTTWGDYCEMVSSSKCKNPDEIAKGEPSDKTEASKYFVDGSFKGYFRITDANDCGKNPSNCTGHFIDPSCNWTTYAENQFNWQNISLASAGSLQPNSGYTAEQVNEIVLAANATKSDIFFWWWTPELLISSYTGTDMEFVRVGLPAPTQECIDYQQQHFGPTTQCITSYEDRIGESVGSCDYQMDELQKVISMGLHIAALQDQAKNPLVLRSPALNYLKAFQVSSLSISHILAKTMEVKKPGLEDYASREGLCEWLYDNIEPLLDQIDLKANPRFFMEADNMHAGLRKAALSLGITSLIWVAITAVMTMKWRTKQTIRLARVDCLIWILLGFALLGASSVTEIYGHCNLTVWLMIIGFTMELVPILIKIATINKLVRYARIHQRADINPRHLDFTLLGVLLMVLAYLGAWVLIDPLKPEPFATILDDEELRSHHVAVNEFCKTEHVFWAYINRGFLALTLIILSVFTFQSRHVFEEFNESQGLAFMIYSHTIFFMLRLGVLSLVNSGIIPLDLKHPTLSIFTSLDAIFAVSFYFGQKFLSIMSGVNASTRSRSKNSRRETRSKNEEVDMEEMEAESFAESRSTLAPNRQFSIHVGGFNMNDVSALSR